MSTRPVFLPELGKYFRRLREDHGWNQRQAVDIARRRRLALSYNTLRWIEDGKIKSPEPEALKALSTLYGISYEEVVGNYAQERFGIGQTRLRSEPQVAAKGFATLPLLSTPISRGRALAIEAGQDRDRSLAFRQDFIKPFTRPVALKVGKKEAAMRPTIEPGDVVLIDQHVSRRRHPAGGRIYAINLGPLTGKDGGILQRVDLSGRTLILSSDNPDKSAFATRTFEIKVATLPDVLVGEVVWFGRSLGSRKRR